MKAADDRQGLIRLAAQTVTRPRHDREFRSWHGGCEVFEIGNGRDRVELATKNERRAAKASCFR